jgi:hypothetical protein
MSPSRTFILLAVPAAMLAVSQLALAEPKKSGGGKGSSDQAATMTAIATAESGGSTKKKKKPVKAKAPGKAKPVPTYNIQNAWPSK